MAKNNLDEYKRKFKQAQKNALEVIARETINQAHDAFDNEESPSGQKWDEVQRRIPGTAAYKYPKRKKAHQTRNILVGGGKGGRMKNSIRIIEAASDSVAVGTDKPYAATHNEGGQVNTGDTSFMMPKRTFLEPLERKKIEKILIEEFRKAF